MADATYFNSAGRISDTRLRQLVATGRLETAVIGQRPYSVMKSLVAYLRGVLKQMAPKKNARS